ncbi:retrovirus-related Pol polyprotein from transposon 17.6 [Trichonephila clavipes]|nr:retrovirus-related Pol polyprotein from transposon 17.6 [Trichonephila clavipes]
MWESCSEEQKPSQAWSPNPILFAPDFATDFILQTDASEVGAGGGFIAKNRRGRTPHRFPKQNSLKAERNYSTVEKELPAIIFGLKRLKHYLDGQKFIIETDHNPLRYLNKMGSTNPRLQRWALSLQPFNLRSNTNLGGSMKRGRASRRLE